MGKSPRPTGQDSGPGRARVPSPPAGRGQGSARPATGGRHDVRARLTGGETARSAVTRPGRIAPTRSNRPHQGWSRRSAGAGTWTTTGRATSPTSSVILLTLSGTCGGGRRPAVRRASTGLGRQVVRGAGRAGARHRRTRRRAGPGAAHRHGQCSRAEPGLLLEDNAVDAGVRAARPAGPGRNPACGHPGHPGR